MSEITRGLSVDLIFEKDYHRCTFPLLTAVVSEVSDRKIILSQTSLPLTPEHLQQAVIVTYSTTKAGQKERYGMTAKITGFLNDAPASASANPKAIVLERTAEARPEHGRTNVRMHFRIQPETDSGLALYHRETRLNLIDISMGGARFSREEIEPLNPGAGIRLQLKIDERAIDLDAGVIRSWIATRPGGTKKNQIVAVSFDSTNAGLEQLLSSKIIAIEQQRSADGKLYKRW
jgi:hypothetical protein